MASYALPSNCGTYIYKGQYAPISRYFGELQNGLPHGVGVNTYLPGSWENYYHLGEFKEGKPHGMGIFYAPNGKVGESGRYEEGSLVSEEYVDPNSFNRVAQGKSPTTEEQGRSPTTEEVAALDKLIERISPPDPSGSADPVPSPSPAPEAAPAPVVEPSMHGGDSAVGRSKPQVSQQASESQFSDWIPLGLGILIAVVICGWILSTQCPKCNQYFVTTDMGSNLVESKNEYKTVMRTSVHRNSRNEKTGTTESPVQIVILLMTYKDNYKCSKCNHTWYSFRRVEHEL
jgi:hypothetical protein